MGSINEVDVVQNPAMGAYALWQFGLGYQAETVEPLRVPLMFIVLPILLNSRTLKAVISTQRGSGLALFVAKFSQDSEDLLGIHSRALILRMLTLRSVGFAVNAGLMRLDYQRAIAEFHALPPKSKNPPVPERLRAIASGAEKLGCWFSRMNISQIATTLRVEF